MGTMPRKRRPSKRSKPEPVAGWPERLRALRVKLGNVDQATAAERIGVSLRAYFYWESGKHVPIRPYQRLIEQLEQSL